MSDDDTESEDFLECFRDFEARERGEEPPPAVANDDRAAARSALHSLPAGNLLDMASIAAKLTGNRHPSTADVRRVRRRLVAAGAAVKVTDGPKARFVSVLSVARDVLTDDRPKPGDVRHQVEILAVLDERGAQGAVQLECLCLACGRRFRALRFEVARDRVHSCGCLRRAQHRGRLARG